MSAVPQNRASTATRLMGSKIISIFLQLAVIPIYFKVLGEQGNGFALWVMSVRSLVQLIDFDVPQGLRHVMMSNARTNEKQFWRCFQTGLTLNAVIGFTGAAILIVSWKFLHGQEYEAFRSIIPLMFLLAGIQMIVDSIGSTLTHPFYAKEEFAQLAITGSIVPSVALILNAILVIVLRNPVAMLIGAVLDSTLTMVATLYLFKRRFGFNDLKFGFERSVAKEIFSVSIKSYPGNISGRIAGTVDRVILGSVAGMNMVTIYNVAVKIPQSLVQIVGSATSMMVPEMVHSAQNEPDSFRAILRRNVAFLSVLYACVMIVASGFSVVILKAWLRVDYPGFAELSILMAIYYTFEMNFSTITTAFYAHKKAHLLFPFALWNALVTTFATGPVAKKFGLVGLGWMNALIDIVQIVPIHWLLTKVIVKDDSMWWYIGRLGGAIVGTTLIAAAISWLLKGVPVGREAILFVGFMPFVCIGVFIISTRLKLVSLPNSVREKLRNRPLAVRLFGSEALKGS